ncbi:MAG: DUF4079 domain-containing protein [Richelia sp.]|nr:DUF4079 domain-containing protein [Richelia sp.]
MRKLGLDIEPIQTARRFFLRYTNIDREYKDEDVVVKNLSSHRKIAPWMFLFLALGYTGGVLSLVMQEQDLFASPHFWTGSVVLLLLLVNGIISLTKFGGNQAALLTIHAYLGSAAFSLMVIHAFLGVKLGMSF